MATSSNSYAAEPAYPALADSLFAQPRLQHTVHDTADNSDWNLENDWDAGILASETNVFRYGSVVGFSRLRTRSNDSNEYVAKIPRHLLITHLLRCGPSSVPNVFIIHPSTFDAFAPIILLKALQSPSTGTGLSREDAIRHLDSVQLFPVHNFPSAAQAIGQVSTSLQQIQERRQRTNEPGNLPIMLIVAGLDTLAEGIVRASNPVKGAAVLAATMRNLTRISRAYATFVSVMLVNTSGLGSAYLESDRQTESAAHSQRPGGEEVRLSHDNGMQSIFQAAGPSLLSNLLMKTLDQGIDTHILVSDVKSTPVAEVIKDRVGPGLGKWGIWARQQ